MTTISQNICNDYTYFCVQAQVMIVPISQASSEYAEEVKQRIRAEKFFVSVDNADNKMEKKIREAQLDQYNYILVRLSLITMTLQITPTLGTP